MIMDSILDEAYALFQKLGKCSPTLFMRKYQLKHDAAMKLCEKVWMRQHLEARELARSVKERI